MATASMRRSPMQSGLMLLFFLFVCFAAAGIGSWWTASSLSTWYQALDKPSWNPPDAVFGPVWTTLYIMMAVSAWFVWKQGPPPAPGVVWPPFSAQLALNTAWSGVFFGLRQPGWAFAELLLLWLAIAATIAVFRRRSRAAAWLLAPYLAWVTFAGALNFMIWRLNA